MTSTLTDKLVRAYGYAPMPDVETDAASIEQFIASVPFIAEEGEGFLVGTLCPFHLNNNILIGCIVMMDGKGNGAVLLERFERWAKNRGAALVQIAIADFPSGDFFEDRGYREVEHMYMRGI